MSRTATQPRIRVELKGVLLNATTRELDDQGNTLREGHIFLKVPQGDIPEIADVIQAYIEANYRLAADGQGLEPLGRRRRARTAHPHPEETHKQ